MLCQLPALLKDGSCCVCYCQARVIAKLHATVDPHVACGPGAAPCLPCRAEGGCTHDYKPEDLAQAVCLSCGQLGHLCCAPAGDLPPYQPSCYNCGQAGHTGEACWMVRLTVLPYFPQPDCPAGWWTLPCLSSRNTRHTKLCFSYVECSCQ